jgi:hypothetical protein
MADHFGHFPKTPFQGHNSALVVKNWGPLLQELLCLGEPESHLVPLGQRVSVQQRAQRRNR